MAYPFSKNLFSRYHHLFAEALQEELMKQYTKQEIKSLVEKTVQLIYGKGDYTSAIELALKHHLYEQAQQWISHHLGSTFFIRSNCNFHALVTTAKRQSTNSPL
ncbi:HTH luxR-type domain-containing protein OS=Lysinibacillus sphaericus OX=1421 GN=LS41612_14560 PE=4 SV=1 [Lysinibacillus sphaericus]